MKLVAAIVVLGGLAAAALWLPIEGRTLWQRAEQRGLPGSAAHAVGSAARTVGTAATGAWRWANSPGPGKTVRRPEAARPPAPGKPAARPAAPAQPHAAPVTAGGPTVPAAAERPRSEDPRVTASARPPAAPAQRDGIVPAAAPETLSEGDRAALDRLVGKARSGR